MPSAPPAICTPVAGPLEIWIGTGASNALEFLGWTTNGAQIEESSMMSPVHSDEAGGEQGVPVDYQIFGYQHRISLEMTKYQTAILSKLSLRYNQNISSGIAGVGMLVSCNGATFRLLLTAPNFVRNYPVTYILDPIDISPIGTQHSRARLSLTVNAPVGTVIFNQVTT